MDMTLCSRLVAHVEEYSKPRKRLFSLQKRARYARAFFCALTAALFVQRTDPASARASMGQWLLKRRLARLPAWQKQAETNTRHHTVASVFVQAAQHSSNPTDGRSVLHKRFRKSRCVSSDVPPAQNILGDLSR